MIKLLFLLVPLSVFSSVPDYFGTDASTIASVGNGSMSNSIYQSPSLAAFQDDFFKLSTIVSFDQLEEINNIVVESPINSSSTTDIYGDLDVNKSRTFLTVQSQFNLVEAFRLKAAFLLVTPTNNLFTFKTSDYFEPEYSLYSSGLERIHGSFHLIHKLSQNYSLSVGAHFGVQGEGEAYIVGRSSSDPNGSSLGEVNLTAKPKAALIFGLTRKWDHSSLSLKLQQRLYSEVEVETIGLTPTGLGSSIDYNLNLIAHQFYDPDIINLSYQRSSGAHSYTTSIEFQNWNSYLSSKLELAKISGVITSSKDYNSISINSPFIPRLSYSYQASQMTKYIFGIKHRPRIIKSDLNGSSNLVDTAITSFSFGQEFQIIPNLHASYGLQYKHLKKQTVTKSPNRENGTAGKKIGSSGYKVGGSLFVLATDISWTF